MARTTEGRRLTEQHKRAQANLGALAAALTTENAKRLDADDLDGTQERWSIAQQAIIVVLRQRSRVLAEDYLRAFWEAEGISPKEFAKLDLRPPAEVVAWVVPTIKARTARHALTGG